MESSVPLNYEASAGDTHKQTTATMPPEVVQCLNNARYLHFATSADNIPHLGLMNYTYLPSCPYTSLPEIVMTTNTASKKVNNLLKNPNVSLLVHDWSSHRPPSGRRPSGGSPEPHQPSSLASLLLNLNSSSISSISATINGTARLLDRDTEEERFYRDQHMKNNTFEGVNNSGAESGANGSTPSVQAEDGGRGCFIAGEAVRVIVVSIREVRISDWKGHVKDWVISPEEPIVNGTS